MQKSSTTMHFWTSHDKLLNASYLSLVMSLADTSAVFYKPPWQHPFWHGCFSSHQESELLTAISDASPELLWLEDFHARELGKGLCRLQFTTLKETGKRTIWGEGVWHGRLGNARGQF